MKNTGWAAFLLGLVYLAAGTTGRLPGQPPGLRVTLVGHADAVNSVAFSGDGKILASGSKDATAIASQESNVRGKRRADRWKKLCSSS